MKNKITTLLFIIIGLSTFAQSEDIEINDSITKSINHIEFDIYHHNVKYVVQPFDTIGFLLIRQDYNWDKKTANWKIIKYNNNFEILKEIQFVTEQKKGIYFTKKVDDDNLILFLKKGAKTGIVIRINYSELRVTRIPIKFKGTWSNLHKDQVLYTKGMLYCFYNHGFLPRKIHKIDFNTGTSMVLPNIKKINYVFIDLNEKGDGLYAVSQTATRIPSLKFRYKLETLDLDGNSINSYSFDIKNSPAMLLGGKIYNTSGDNYIIVGAFRTISKMFTENKNSNNKLYKFGYGIYTTTIDEKRGNHTHFYNGCDNFKDSLYTGGWIFELCGESGKKPNGIRYPVYSFQHRVSLYQSDYFSTLHHLPIKNKNTINFIVEISSALNGYSVTNPNAYFILLKHEVAIYTYDYYNNHYLVIKTDTSGNYISTNRYCLEQYGGSSSGTRSLNKSINFTSIDSIPSYYFMDYGQIVKAEVDLQKDSLIYEVRQNVDLNLSSTKLDITYGEYIVEYNSKPKAHKIAEDKYLVYGYGYSLKEAKYIRTKARPNNLDRTPIFYVAKVKFP